MRVAAGRSAAVVEGLWVSYRHTWRATLVSSFLSPLLFLLAIGVGLGSRIDSGGPVEGLTYAAFVAPGLLAATCMQVATFEATYPVMAGIKWFGTYRSILATPVGVPDLVAGRVAWIALRLTAVAAVFMVVTIPFGVSSGPLAVLALPAAVLTGLAVAAPIEAWAASRDDEQGFVGLFRFVILPMFLFAGTFFPVSQLPDWLQPVAWITPLWHGTELTRGFMTGAPDPLVPLHLAVLLVLAVAGTLAATVTYRRRLEP
jgi:lipooligosaccharide transport system permease protein